MEWKWSYRAKIIIESNEEGRALSLEKLKSFFLNITIGARPVMNKRYCTTFLHIAYVRAHGRAYTRM